MKRDKLTLWSENKNFVSITHPITKKFKVIDAQVWSEDRVVNYNIFQLQAWA